MLYPLAPYTKITKKTKQNTQTFQTKPPVLIDFQFAITELEILYNLISVLTNGRVNFLAPCCVKCNIHNSITLQTFSHMLNSEII